MQKPAKSSVEFIHFFKIMHFNMSPAKCRPLFRPQCVNNSIILWAGWININITAFAEAALYPEVCTLTNNGLYNPEYTCTLSTPECDHSNVDTHAVMLLCCHAHVWWKCVTFEEFFDLLLFKADGTPRAYLAHMHIYSNWFQLNRCYIFIGTYM